MKRSILAVIAGAAVWAALWLGGMQASTATFPDALSPDRPITATGALLGLIAYSVALSILAGWVAARVKGPRPMPTVYALAALQLAFGVVAEASSWDLMPVWYHLVFLALIVPATVYGGRLRAGAAPEPTPRPA